MDVFEDEVKTSFTHITQGVFQKKTSFTHITQCISHITQAYCFSKRSQSGVMYF